MVYLLVVIHFYHHRILHCLTIHCNSDSDRYIRAQNGKCRVLTSQIQKYTCTYILCMKPSLLPASRPTYLMASHLQLLLLLWCIAIAGYHISTDNSNSQQQPAAAYKQTSKSLATYQQI